MTLLNRNIVRNINPDDDEVQLLEVPTVGDDFFRKLPEDPIKQATNLVKTYRKEPLKFIKYELGVPTDIWPNDAPPAKRWTRASLPLWSKQREIVHNLIKYKKVAVKSGHGVGKTRVAAVCALSLHYVWRAMGITTAPTFRQVRRVLWGEIHDLYNNSPRKLGGNLFQTSLESGDKWFIEGFSTRDPSSSITGFHEENIFVIIDEAGGVDQQVYDSIEGILTSENSFVLLIGNPLDAASPFADAFREDSEYYKITINCYDSPNVKNRLSIYPKLCAYDWPERMKKKWGVDSNLFRVRVIGEFPTEGRDTLIPVKYIDMALERFKEFEETPKTDVKIISFGIDVARLGMDATVYGVIKQNIKTGLKHFEILEETEKQRIDETVERGMYWYDKLITDKKDRPVINVDDIGLGGGVSDYLLRNGYPVNPINVGETPDTYEENEEKFLNKRAFYYWKVREDLVNGQLCLNDDGVAFELSKIGLDFSRRGGEKIKIEEKKDIRKKLQGRSPDRADCCMLANSEYEELATQRWIF